MLRKQPFPGSCTTDPDQSLEHLTFFPQLKEQHLHNTITLQLKQVTVSLPQRVCRLAKQEKASGPNFNSWRQSQATSLLNTGKHLFPREKTVERQVPIDKVSLRCSCSTFRLQAPFILSRGALYHLPERKHLFMASSNRLTYSRDQHHYKLRHVGYYRASGWSAHNL